MRAAASTHRRALAAISAACLAFLLGSCARPEAAAGAPAALLLTGGYVVDPAAAGPPRHADVLVVGGRIAAVGTAVRAPPNARRVDVRGQYLIPGLWDMHAHVAAIGETGDALQDYVHHGVLGIRDMGGRADEVLALRSAVAEGRLLGPTMVVAGPTLNGAASADFHRAVGTAEEARAAVRALRADGVDFIKIHRQTSREAFLAIRDQALAEGLPLSGHVPLAIGWIEAAEAGMRTVEHVQGIVESEIREGVEPVRATFEAIERLQGARGDTIFAALARNGTAWTPTLIYYENSWLTDSPERRALKQRAYGEMRPLVLRAARAGVPILAGTDLMERRGQGLLNELSRLVAAGLTPREALAAATTSARAVAGRGPGPIRAGEEASLLVLRGNPLDRIENVASLSWILLRGRLIEAGALRH